MKSVFEAFLAFSFDTSAFDNGIHTDVYINVFVESNCTPTTIRTVKLSGVDITVDSAFCRKIQCHVFHSMSAADLVSTRFVKMDINVASLFYTYRLQCVEEINFHQQLAKYVCSGMTFGTLWQWFRKDPSTPPEKIVPLSKDVKRCDHSNGYVMRRWCLWTYRQRCASDEIWGRSISQRISTFQEHLD